MMDHQSSLVSGDSGVEREAPPRNEFIKTSPRLFTYSSRIMFSSIETLLYDLKKVSYRSPTVPRRSLQDPIAADQATSKAIDPCTIEVRLRYYLAMDQEYEPYS